MNNNVNGGNNAQPIIENNALANVLNNALANGANNVLASGANNALNGQPVFAVRNLNPPGNFPPMNFLPQPNIDAY